jgi:hypothetical protein
MRAELRKLNLDWNAAPIPDQPTATLSEKPVHIILEESAHHG